MFFFQSYISILRLMQLRILCFFARTTFIWMKAHKGTLGNEESDRLAKGGEKYLPCPHDFKPPNKLDQPEAKLRAIN